MTVADWTIKFKDIGKMCASCVGETQPATRLVIWTDSLVESVCESCFISQDMTAAGETWPPHTHPDNQ